MNLKGSYGELNFEHAKLVGHSVEEMQQTIAYMKLQGMREFSLEDSD